MMSGLRYMALLLEEVDRIKTEQHLHWDPFNLAFDHACHEAVERLYVAGIYHQVLSAASSHYRGTSRIVQYTSPRG